MEEAIQQSIKENDKDILNKFFKSTDTVSKPKGISIED